MKRKLVPFLLVVFIFSTMLVTTVSANEEESTDYVRRVYQENFIYTQTNDECRHDNCFSLPPDDENEICMGDICTNDHDCIEFDPYRRMTYQTNINLANIECTSNNTHTANQRCR